MDCLNNNNINKDNLDADGQDLNNDLSLKIMTEINSSQNILDINTIEKLIEERENLRINLIEENEQLISLSEKINSEDLTENDKEEEEDSIIKIDPDKYIALYNFKDFLLMLGLLITSSFNFNFLYIPFLLSGILYSIFIYNNRSKQRKFKSIFNLIILIYSSLNLIFEIVIIIFIL